MRKLCIALVVLWATFTLAQVTLRVSDAPGTTVLDKYNAALTTCGSTDPCVVILDKLLPKRPGESLPSPPANVTVIDERISHQKDAEYVLTDDARLGQGGGPADWNTMTNKPSTFTPSAHNHTTGEITNFPTTWAWTDLSGVPSTFTPSAHTHVKANITDFPTLATVATSGSYADLSNKPSIPAIPTCSGTDKLTGNGSILSCATDQQGAGGALTNSVASASADVTMTTAGTFYDGPSLSLAAGTWLLNTNVTLQTTSTTAAVQFVCKLWDGTTVKASSEGVSGAVGTAAVRNVQLNLTGIATPASTATWKVSCTSNTASQLIKAATPQYGSGNNATNLVAVKIG